MSAVNIGINLSFSEYGWKNLTGRLEHIPFYLEASLTALNPDFTGAVGKCGQFSCTNMSFSSLN